MQNAAGQFGRLAAGYRARLAAVKARLDDYHQDVWNRRAAAEGYRDTARWIRGAESFLAGEYDKTYPGPSEQHGSLQEFREYWAADSLRDALRSLVQAERDAGLRSAESARAIRGQPRGSTLEDLLAGLEAEERAGTEDIDAALAPLAAAREDLAGRIGALAAAGLARLIRRELPGAVHADLAWTTDGDATYLEPAGAFYDAAGAEITVADPIRLETQLLRYASLLDETNTAAWHHLVTSHDTAGGRSIRRLDVAAALAQPLPPALPALPAWTALLEAEARAAGRTVTGEEAERIAGALSNSTIPEALGEIFFAVCGPAPDPGEPGQDSAPATAPRAETTLRHAPGPGRMPRTPENAPELD